MPNSFAQVDANGVIGTWAEVPTESEALAAAEAAAAQGLGYTAPEAPPGWVQVPDNQRAKLAVGAVLAGGVITPKGSDPRLWWIGVGVFFDRFLTAKMAVLTSTNAVAKALILDAQVRPYIDLKSPALAQGLAALQAQNIAGVTPAIVASITTTPTTEAERHVKGLS